MSCKEVYIMRHGESLYNLVSRQLKDATPEGLIDSTLSPAGITQVNAVSSELKGKGFDVIVCSPLQRAVQTAVMLGLGVPIKISPLCRERVLTDGDYGSPRKTLQSLYPALDFSTVPEDDWWGVETPEELSMRMGGLCEYLRSLKYSKVLVVSHYGVIEKLLDRQFKNCEYSMLLRTVVYNNIPINVSANTQFCTRWGSTIPDEPETLRIFEHFLTKKAPYFDIGSCFGQTVIYGSKLAKHVYGIEPDPRAWHDLNANVSANNLKNVTLINKALSNAPGKIRFGCKGGWGNSKSSVVLTDKMAQIIEVDSTVIEDLILEHPGIKECNFLKMDIEGAEKLVIPALRSYLEKYNPTLYISLHTKWKIITVDETRAILDILYSIYKYAYHRDLRRTMTKDEILTNQTEQIIFSNNNILK